MYKIVCDAVPFCFGPISKLLTISEKISCFADLTLLASGTSEELGKYGPFKKIIKCNTENQEDLQKNKAVFESADLFLSVMNPVSTKYAKSLDIPVAQVDSLFWMWDSISKEVAESDLYFIQNFDGVFAQLEKFKTRLKNPLVVGPIIEKKPLVQKQKNQLVVNFGGIESGLIKIGKNSNYPFTMASILFKVLQKKPIFDSVIFTGLDWVMKRLSNECFLENISFNSLEHKNFLKELASSKMLLTSPGLTTSFEAFSFEIPTFFLPPQNYSQYWNLEKFFKQGVAYQNTNWNNVFSDTEIKENEPEALGVKKILNALKRFEDDKKAQKKVESMITKTLSIGEKETIKVKNVQKKYFNLLGSNGTQKISETIRNYLEVKEKCEYSSGALLQNM